MASLIKRGKKFYIQYYLSGKPKRRSLGTESLQVAKERLRQFESALVCGLENPLPSRTPIALEAAYFEQVTTANVSEFIASATLPG